MQRMLNHMKLQANLATGGSVNCKMAIVKSYDPNEYACKVMLQPEGVESGWLPISSQWVGNQWGIFAPPTIGDSVLVLFVDGSPDVGCIIANVCNNENRPVNILAGEMRIIHKSDSCLKFNNDGTVDLQSDGDLRCNAGGKFIVDATEMDVNCNINVSGDVAATGEIFDHTGTMQAMRDVYNSHTHLGDGAASPPAQTGTPSGAM